MQKPFNRCTNKILSLVIFTLLFAIASSMPARTRLKAQRKLEAV